MSPQSFNKWKKFPLLYTQTIECFSEIFAQSKIDQNRIKLLTKRNIKFIGNLKLVTPNITLEKNNHSNLKKDEKFITLMITSTHDNEEAQLLPIIKNLLLFRVTSSCNIPQIFFLFTNTSLGNFRLIFFYHRSG